jgi:hypothetical protein
MLGNSVAAGALASAYILVLVLQLNPGLRLSPIDLQPLVATIGQYYLLHLSALFYAMLVVRQVFARELFSPAWVSIGVLSWLGATAAAAGSALMWANIRTFALVLPPDTVRAMTLGAVALACSALCFVAIAIVRRRTDAGRRQGLAVGVVVVAAASLAVPVGLRGNARMLPPDGAGGHAVADVPGDLPNAPLPERSAKVTIIAIDAGSLELISNAAAEGRLPNFGRILDSGAVMHMATLHPTSAPAVWTAVATGKLPQKNGVRSAAVYRLTPGGNALSLLPDYCFANGLVRLGFLAEEPHTSSAVRARTLWSILTAHGVDVGVVNWPLTYPADRVRGYVVTDLYARRALTPLGLDDPRLVYPPDLQDETRAEMRALLEAREPLPGVSSGALADRHQATGRFDRVHDRLRQTIAASRPSQVTIVRHESLDPAGHYFLRYAMPSNFGDVTDDERRRYGRVLENHYGLIDEVIGRAIATLDADDLLLVVSGYGMEPLGLGKRLVERLIGDPDVSGTHEAAPDGFLMAYGAPVAAGRHLTRASIVDVVPTTLYFLGLPVGRDMDGYARTSLFRPAFTDEHPITFIPSYE